MSEIAEYGLPLIRVFVGLLMTVHGAQKTFGWFGGKGFAGALSLVDRQGMRPRYLWAVTVCATELLGGIALALGFLTPFAAAFVVAQMIVILRHHSPQGFFNQEGGIEFPLLILVSVVGVALAGAGPKSLDAAFGIQEVTERPASYIIALCLALVGPAVAFATRLKTTGEPGETGAAEPQDTLTAGGRNAQ